MNPPKIETPVPLNCRCPGFIGLFFCFLNVFLVFTICFWGFWFLRVWFLCFFWFCGVFLASLWFSCFFGWGSCPNKSLACACHPCAGAMLICSASFHFRRGRPGGLHFACFQTCFHATADSPIDLIQLLVECGRLACLLLGPQSLLQPLQTQWCQSQHNWCNQLFVGRAFQE